MAFPDFFRSALGEAFLVQFYRAFLVDGTAVTVVARSPNGSVQGAVVGTTESEDFFGRLVKNRWPWVLVASVRATLTNPKAAQRLHRAVRYRGDIPAGGQGALLSSICVEPSLQGMGVGRQDLEARTREVVGRGGAYGILVDRRRRQRCRQPFPPKPGLGVFRGYTTREVRSMNLYAKHLDAR